MSLPGKHSGPTGRHDIQFRRRNPLSDTEMTVMTTVKAYKNSVCQPTRWSSVPRWTNDATRTVYVGTNWRISRFAGGGGFGSPSAQSLLWSSPRTTLQLTVERHQRFIGRTDRWAPAAVPGVTVRPSLPRSPQNSMRQRRLAGAAGRAPSHRPLTDGCAADGVDVLRSPFHVPASVKCTLRSHTVGSRSAVELHSRFQSLC